MLDFIEIVKTLSALGFSPLNLVLIVMLYFIGAHSGIFPTFWKKEEDKAPNIRDLHNEVSNLKLYFNHETTENLEDIKSVQKELKETALRTYETVGDIKRKQEEYDRYGIKVRTQ